MTGTSLNIGEICNSITDDYKVLGTIDRRVTHPSPIHNAKHDSISFCSYKGEKALKAIRESQAQVIICSKELLFEENDYTDKTFILVSNPRLAFIRVMQKYFQEKPKFGIHPSAVIDEDAKVHHNVYIGPNTCITGKCEIGENTIIYGNVYMYPNVRIGRNVIIHAGTVIGADGFGYERNDKGDLEKFPHIGGVIIGDNVEIGANCTVDRATFLNNATILSNGAKLDDQVHIGHNAKIGARTAIAAQTCISGTAEIGEDVWIGAGVTVSDSVRIGNRAKVLLNAVVAYDVAEDEIVSGFYAMPHKQWKRVYKKLKEGI